MCADTRLKRWRFIIVQYTIAIILYTHTLLWILQLTSRYFIPISSEIDFVCTDAGNSGRSLIEIQFAILIKITVFRAILFTHFNFIFVTPVLIPVSTDIDLC